MKNHQLKRNADDIQYVIENLITEIENLEDEVEGSFRGKR